MSAIIKIGKRVAQDVRHEMYVVDVDNGKPCYPSRSILQVLEQKTCVSSFLNGLSIHKPCCTIPTCLVVIFSQLWLEIELVTRLKGRKLELVCRPRLM